MLMLGHFNPGIVARIEEVFGQNYMTPLKKSAEASQPLDDLYPTACNIPKQITERGWLHRQASFSDQAFEKKKQKVLGNIR